MIKEGNNFEDSILSEQIKKEEQDLTPLKHGIMGEKIAGGTHSSVYEIKKPTENFGILKIGEIADYSPPLLNVLKITFNREKASKLLKKAFGDKFQITPDIDFIKNGVAEYLLMKEYFGFGDTENNEKEAEDTNPGKREELLSDLLNPHSQFYKEIKNVVGSEFLMKKIVDIAVRQKRDNFLPKEQTVIGHPPELTKEHAESLLFLGKKLPATYFIFQTPIRGENIFELRQLEDRELADRPELLEKLIFFAILSKKMYFDTGKYIDMRPEEFLKNPLEWFQNSSNLLIDKGKKKGEGKLFFVDTRWLWDKESFLGKGGKASLIEIFGTRSIDRAIKKYIGLLGKK